MRTILDLLAHVWKAGAFSPTAFVVRAIIIALLFCVSELLGLKEYTIFLSGTFANLAMSWQTAATLGLRALAVQAQRRGVLPSTAIVSKKHQA